MRVTLGELRLKITAVGAYYHQNGKIGKVELLALPHGILARMPPAKRPIYVSVYLYIIGVGIWMTPLDICTGLGLTYSTVKTSLEKLVSTGVVERDSVATNYSYYRAKNDEPISKHN